MLDAPCLRGGYTPPDPTLLPTHGGIARGNSNSSHGVYSTEFEDMGKGDISKKSGGHASRSPSTASAGGARFKLHGAHEVFARREHAFLRGKGGRFNITRA